MWLEPLAREEEQNTFGSAVTSAGCFAFVLCPSQRSAVVMTVQQTNEDFFKMATIIIWILVVLIRY